MDVQMENMDPSPCESQSSGKIRKGFKLFGKRKPGNIFSIRSKGDGNNKSPVNKSKTQDGLSESAAPESEHEPDKEKGQEVSQGEMEQAEETLGEDGVLAASHARTSISSASSAKSLSFLSLLRGGRRGAGDRRVHTVSQPVGRQRRGLKGLFGNVKFRSKDKEDKEEAPPSPLLMSSRANSVEIIKEDLTLTPRPQPRSLDSPETESGEPITSLTSQDSTATTPSETVTPKMTAGSVSKTNEHVPPLLASEPPLVPGDTSLSCLLADISSLLTFDSITGGGDIMADVEAEWGKASSSISATMTEVMPSSTSLFSKPTISLPLTSTFVSITATPVAIPTTSSTKSFTPPTKTTSDFSTFTARSVKLSSDSTPASEPSTSIKIQSTPPKPSTTPVTMTSFSPAVKPSPLMTIKSTPSSTFATTTAPLNTLVTTVKTPSINPALTSTVSKMPSEIAAPPQMIPLVSKPSPVATPPPAPAKPPPVTHSPPTPVAFTQPPPAKLEPDNNLNPQTFSSYKPSQSSAARESQAPVTVSPACSVSTKTSSSAFDIPSKMTTNLESVALSKSILTPSPMDLKQTPSSLVTVSHPCPSPTLTATSKIQTSPAPVPTPLSNSLDKIPPTTKPAPAPVSLDKMPPAPTTDPTPPSHVVLSPAPHALGQIPASKAPIIVSKDLPVPVQVQDFQSKAPSAPAQIPVSVSKAPPSPAQIQVSQSKEPPAPAQIQISQSKAPPAPAQIQVSVSTDPPALAEIPVSQPKAPLAPTSALAPCPVSSLPSTPAPSTGEASAEMRGSRQASGQLASPSSMGDQGAQTMSSKMDERHNESGLSHQGPSRERRIPQVKASGLSKIPVVGGGRAGRLPVRESQHVDDEASRDQTTPVLEEERRHFNSHDEGSKDKINDVGVIVPTSKRTQEESQQPPQMKALTSLPRDSKIPVKHGAQSHTASQIPQAKEHPRTKIPVSKVPVRRIGNKPAAAGGSAQIRK